MLPSIFVLKLKTSNPFQRLGLKYAGPTDHRYCLMVFLVPSGVDVVKRLRKSLHISSGTSLIECHKSLRALVARVTDRYFQSLRCKRTSNQVCQQGPSDHVINTSSFSSPLLSNLLSDSAPCFSKQLRFPWPF